MKKRLLAALLAGTLLLTACQYAVVEDNTEVVQGLPGFAAKGEASVPEDGPEPLARGARDKDGADDVRRMQELLVQLGFLSGGADGVFGVVTEGALKEFQRVNGLPDTGVADVDTMAALASEDAAPMPTPEPTPLASGAKGEDVRAVQQRLAEYGFFTGAADADFGSKTDAAVRSFQQYLLNSAAGDAPAPTAPPAPDIPKAPAPSGEQAEESPGAAPDGVVSDGLLEYLREGAFQVYRQPLARGDSGAEVARLQTRLISLQYLDSGADGIFGGATESALKYFQKRNQLEQTGRADESTQRLLFSATAMKSDRPRQAYLLKVDTSKQRVYAYQWADGSYSRLVKTMTCSTGTRSHPTPLGTYRSGGRLGRWYYFNKYNCWAQYAYQISGPYYFHSVIYSRKDASSLRQGSVYNLGSRASHGCVRLSVADARWIYENCPAGTTVRIV